MTAPEPYDFVDGYLGATLLDQAGEIRELSENCDAERERADRFDLGSLAAEFFVAQKIADGHETLPIPLVMNMLASVAQYGASGMRTRMMDALLRDVEETLR